MGFEIKNGILIEYEPEPGVTEVVIPDGVTEIKGFAFAEGCEAIESLTIPESVLRIGDCAFPHGHCMKSIKLPRNVERVPRNAFNWCAGLAEILVDERNEHYASVDGVLLTKDLKKIVAFPRGKSGHYVAPESVSSISRRTFRMCANLLSVTLPGRVEMISFYAFDRCRNLESVNIPNGVDKVVSPIFSECKKLRSVKGIREEADTDRPLFFECPGMADDDGFVIRGGVLEEYFGYRKTVTVPSGVKEIGRHAFDGHSEITTVILPESVQKIGGGAFYGCCGLADADGFVVFRGVLYDYFGKDGAVSIPNFVTEIDDMAFYERYNVESVIVPESVKKIGFGAFSSCDDGCLKEVTVLADDLEFDEFKNAFDGDDGVRIRGREGSTAQRYARECGIPFEIIK